MIKKIIYWILVILNGAGSIFFFHDSREMMRLHFTVDYSQNSLPLDNLSDSFLNVAIFMFVIYSLLLLFKGKILKD